MPYFKICLTILLVLVIMSPYLLYKFVRSPIGSIKSLRDDWKMINGDWFYDYTSTHTEKKSKET
jgi:hypothetical protein